MQADPRDQEEGLRVITDKIAEKKRVTTGTRESRESSQALRLERRH